SALASAAPTATTPIYPEQTTSESFTLVANVTSGDLSPSIQNWVLTSYHTGAGTAYAVLQADTPRFFYANGTAEEISGNRGNVLTDEGTAPDFITDGIVLSAPSTASDSVAINAGTGTQNVGITRGTHISYLFGPTGQGFYACERVPVEGQASAVLLFEKQKETPEGCAEVVLLPQCGISSGASHPTSVVSGCYQDVSYIDWSVYSA
ncbi:hypothetical protein LAWI1_G007920, partial [Lachnellula willkommii]